MTKSDAQIVLEALQFYGRSQSYHRSDGASVYIDMSHKAKDALPAAQRLVDASRVVTDEPVRYCDICDISECATHRKPPESEG